MARLSVPGKRSNNSLDAVTSSTQTKATVPEHRMECASKLYHTTIASISIAGLMSSPHVHDMNTIPLPLEADGMCLITDFPILVSPRGTRVAGMTL